MAGMGLGVGGGGTPVRRKACRKTGPTHDPALVVDAISVDQGHPGGQVHQFIEVLHLPIGIKKGMV